MSAARHVEVPTPGGPIVLVVPTSQRLVSQAIGLWLEHVTSPPSESATHAERRDYAEHADLLACAGLLQLATSGGPCPIIDRWCAGGYAADPNAAPNDLLAWLENAGVYLADVSQALLEVQRRCNTPSEALVREVAGNSRPSAATP